ncbi:MAG: hypothetical protein K5865_00600 [Eubacterium sp.]|nr:hypothetical protein [Eubacterium sp.]
MKLPRVIASAVAAVVLEKIIAFFVWPLRESDVGGDVGDDVVEKKSNSH